MSAAEADAWTPARALPTASANLLLYVIFAFVAAAIGWAALSRIDTVTRGQGRVIPSLQLQRVAHLEGGIVREILVRQGARVTKGQPLVRLDPTQSAAELGRGAAGSDASAARLIRLEAETNGTALVFPRAIEQSAPAQVAAERALYRARRVDLDASLLVATAKRAGAERQRAEADAEVAARTAARTYAERDLAMIGPLVDAGVEPRAERLRAEGAVAQARANEAAALAARGRAQAGVDEADGEARSIREKFRAAAMEARAETRGLMATARATLPALRDKLDRAELRAPIAGTVNRLLVNTVGGVVRAGEPLVEIVPLDDTLVVETRMSPRDIGFIRPGQAATIRLTAYDSAIYGGLKGTVERIGADAVTDEAAKESYYVVRVRTRGTLSDAAGRPLSIVPGMVAEVDVLGAPRSVLSYLLTPLERVKDSAFRER